MTLADLRTHGGIRLTQHEWDDAITWLKNGNCLELAGCNEHHPLIEHLAKRAKTSRIHHTRALTLADITHLQDDPRGALLLAGCDGDDYDLARIALFAKNNDITRTRAADILGQIAPRRIAIPAISPSQHKPIAAYITTGYTARSGRNATAATR